MSTGWSCSASPSWRSRARPAWERNSPSSDRPRSVTIAPTPRRSDSTSRASAVERASSTSTPSSRSLASSRVLSSGSSSTHRTVGRACSAAGAAPRSIPAGVGGRVSPWATWAASWAAMWFWRSVTWRRSCSVASSTVSSAPPTLTRKARVRRARRRSATTPGTCGSTRISTTATSSGHSRLPIALMIMAAVIRRPPRSSSRSHAECPDRRPNPDRAPRRQSRPGPLSAGNSGAGRRSAAHAGVMDLELLGWDGAWADLFAPWTDSGHRPGRVLAAHRGGDLVATAHGELLTQVTGRLRHLAGPGVADLPAVGDWVALRDGRIQAALPRRTAVTRRMPGSAAQEQVLAANVDLVVIVVAPGRDANPRRVERLLALAWESGAQPVVVLGRADLCPDHGSDVATELAGLAAVAPGVRIMALSCFTGQRVDEIAAMLTPGRTAVLLGSSGVGKSTLVNRLAGRDLLATGEVRDDGKGRHTTTTRQLVVLAGGGLVIDTPGLRELGLWTNGAGTAAAFDDVEALAAGCRFDDCRHRTEPGCAVLQALEDGRLPAERFAGWQKLQRKLAWAERRADPVAAATRRRQIRALSRSIRANNLHRGRD